MADDRNATDLLNSGKTFLIFWGLPIGAMVAVIGESHPIKTFIWVTALAWMGVACLINARRCGRVHCYYTGPFFLFMIIPVLLHGFQWLWLGPQGWTWLGISIGVLGGGLWCLSERIFGTYRNPTHSTGGLENDH